nr:uncharacterized protein LOC119184502 isoform X2 [Rhipicephalus microplus]
MRPSSGADHFLNLSQQEVPEWLQNKAKLGGRLLLRPGAAAASVDTLVDDFPSSGEYILGRNPPPGYFNYSSTQSPNESDTAASQLASGGLVTVTSYRTCYRAACARVR